MSGRGDDGRVTASTIATSEVLRRETLADQISKRLLAHIQDRSVRPNEALPSEHKLADIFGVSRPVIREALIQLKSLGVIEIRSGRPPLVRDLDARLPTLFFEHCVAVKPEEVVDLLEVRRGLEMQSAVLAARRAEAVDHARLCACADDMKTLLDEGRHGEFIERDVQFHLAVAEAGRNDMLQMLVRAIREPMRESILQGIAAQDSEFELRRLHAIHHDIVIAVTERDEGAAATAMARHFDQALTAIVAGQASARTPTPSRRES